jgi:simple sugar transport system ATP-binding protein
VLAVRHVSKAFGATQANADVSLEIDSGEIVGLVGENGAGKSTLLSIIGGFLKPDAGEIAVDGRVVPPGLPASARNAGIGMVHQQLSLVPTFTVREQITLAGWKERTLPGLLAGDLDGDDVIERLPPGKRQRLEIAKAIVANPVVLLLDEPTSILAPTEVEALFTLLDLLRSDGAAIVIVTHKLREVMSIADRIVVMTSGRIVGSFSRVNGDWPDETERSVLALMFEWSPEQGASDAILVKTSGPPTEFTLNPVTVLDVDGIATEPAPGSQPLHDIHFELIAGHVHSIVGVDGQGQTELAEVMTGYRISAGGIALAGEDVSRLPAVERAAAGMGLLVDDRLGEAAVGSFSVAENIVLKRPRKEMLVRWGVFRRSVMTGHAQHAIDAWDVHPRDPGLRFDTLSGGNMQRVIAARELERAPLVLVAVNPVQGLDARTAEFMWRHLRNLCDAGSAVLFFTPDLDEAITHSDLLSVIFDGRLSSMTIPRGADRQDYGSMMVNGW